MGNKVKKGITLMILVVTIIILAIMLGASIYSSVNVIDKSSMADFRTTISRIEDLVQTYKLTNGSLPVTSSIPINYSGITSALSGDALANCTEQLTANQDTDSLFYYVDFDKINVTQTGFSVEGKVVINDEGTHAYYLPGMYISGKWYFTNYSYDN